MRKNSISSTVLVTLVWVCGLFITFVIDGPRIAEAGVLDLLVSWNFETTLPLLLLVVLPVLVLLFPHASDCARGNPKRKRGTLATQRDQTPPSGDSSDSPRGKQKRNLLLQVICIYGLSLVSSWSIGQTPIPLSTPDGKKIEVPFCSLPPAYHDEYSYLLQAETFRNGRMTWPAAPTTPDLWHQFHVLNERVTVSRYFPTTGLWMAPFLSAGNPIWGHWLAGALAAVLFFLSARLMMPGGAAFLCGLLLSVSPGLAIFSNMLLAHHPTMLALSVFLLCFLKLMRSATAEGNSARAFGSRLFLLSSLSGAGLSAAMLGRPMTAAGFAAPFGIWLAVELLRRRLPAATVVAGFLVPLLAGFGILALCNHAATGDWSTTAYQQYTDQFTPRHRFGFNNATDVPDGTGPLAVQKYDDWAINLTPSVAAKNVGLRLKYSLIWTLNIVVLGMGLVAAIVRLFGSATEVGSHDNAFPRTPIWVLFASILSLHVVHIPYWYAGILEWHYVFETAPLLLLVSGFGLAHFHSTLRTLMKPRLATVWCMALVSAATIPAWMSSPDYLGTSKVAAWIDQMAWSRRRFAEFQMVTSSDQIQKPALILLDESKSDPQLSYVINPPDYQSNILVCRVPRSEEELQQLREQFPDRNLYLWETSQPVFTMSPFDPHQKLPAN